MSKTDRPPSWDPDVRRERYHSDKTYRKRAIRSTRSSYRDKHGRVDNTTCLDNLDGLEHFGTERSVSWPRGSVGLQVTFTSGQLAGAMNRRVEVVYRWVRREMFPPPVCHVLDTSNQHDNVYLLPEARAILRVIGEHQRDTPYYRADHHDTRKKLFGAVEEARSNP